MSLEVQPIPSVSAAEAPESAFVNHFGPLLEERVQGQTHSYVTNAAGHDVDEMGDAYKFGALTAHMDFTYTRYPADGISLFGLAIPAKGAQTVFYSNALPLARMPEELLAELHGYTIRCTLELDAPENTFVHDWSEGDFVFWDNLAVQHARAAIPAADGERTLRRVSFCIQGNGIEETVRFLDAGDATQTFG